MPFAPKIRRDILTALEGSILPALRMQQIPMWTVAPPFEPPTEIRLRMLQKSIPQSTQNDLNYPLTKAWPKAKIHATSQRYIGFLYEGIADERTIITPVQARTAHTDPGVYAIRWQAPCILLFPPGIPRNQGGVKFWNAPEPHPETIKILWIDAITSETLVHTHIEIEGVHISASHSLRIKDTALTQLLSIFIGELTKVVHDNSILRTVFSAAMLCLQRDLLHVNPTIANTSRPPISQVKPKPRTATEQAWSDTLTYIHTHLDEDLTLANIVQRTSISQAHLNRLFRSKHKLSVMEYVRTQRIEAAKRILAEGNENIAEISQLVGFKSSTTFGKAFRHLVGTTPSQFQNNMDKRLLRPK